LFITAYGQLVGCQHHLHETSQIGSTQEPKEQGFPTQKVLPLKCENIWISKTGYLLSTIGIMSSQVFVINKNHGRVFSFLKIRLCCK